MEEMRIDVQENIEDKNELNLVPTIQEVPGDYSGSVTLIIASTVAATVAGCYVVGKVRSYLKKRKEKKVDTEKVGEIVDDFAEVETIPEEPEKK